MIYLHCSATALLTETAVFGIGIYPNHVAKGNLSLLVANENAFPQGIIVVRSQVMSWKLEKESGSQEARVLLGHRYLEDPESWEGPKDFIRLENKPRNRLSLSW